MKRFGLVVALAAILASGSSRAQMVTSLFTDATDSTPTSFGSCANVVARCDQSVLDASADAVLEVRACAASTDSWQACSSVRSCPNGGLPDATDVEIGAPPVGKPYLMTHVQTSPSSDTARMILTCAEESGARDRGCRTVPFSASGDYGPYTIKGGTLRFDLDGNAALSSVTVGAIANVTGCSVFGSTSSCSCDLAGGGTQCAEYNGTSGNAGFVVPAPRTVTVTIKSASVPGTFSLCSW